MAYRAMLLLPVFILVVSLVTSVRATLAAPEAQLISQVRVVHATPGAPPLDILVDGIRLPIPAPAFGQATPYLNLPAGPHEFALAPAGVPAPVAVVTSSLALVPGQPYTLMVISVPPSLLVLEDARFAAIGGPSRIRFVHASPDAPPAVDLAVVGGETLFAGVGYGQATPYIDMPAGTVSLEVRAAGTSTIVLAMPDVALVAGTVYTFGDIGLVGGTPPIGLLTLSDS